MSNVTAGHSGYLGKSVLVTGGLGFIGSNLVIELVGSGADVTIIDSLIPEFGGNPYNIEPVREKVDLHIADLRDRRLLDELVQGKDFIFHLAGQVSHGDSMRDPERDLEVNCLSTLYLLESCRKHNPGCKLVYTSTRQVYGKAQRLPVMESDPTLPIDVNGINKLAAEYYHLLYDRTYGIRSVVLRLTNTYGPRQQIISDRQGFVGIFIRQALLGQTIRIFGDGEQRRDFNYVDDVVSALLLAGSAEECSGRMFNLGASCSYSLNEFVGELAKHVELDVTYMPFPRKKAIIDIGSFYSDDSLFRAASSWSPQVELAEGLGRTVSFYRANWQHYLT